MWLRRCRVFDAGSAAGSGGFRWAPAMQRYKWVKASCQKWRVPWPASGRPRTGFAGSRSGPLLDSDGIRAGSRFCRGFRWVLPWVPVLSAGFWPRSYENGPRLFVENDWPTPSRIAASSSVVLFIVGHCAAMVRSRGAASKRGQGQASDAGACVVG